MITGYRVSRAGPASPAGFRPGQPLPRIIIKRLEDARMQFVPIVAKMLLLRLFIRNNLLCFLKGTVLDGIGKVIDKRK